MNVLVIGSGGREHALAWRLAQSPSVDRVFAAPGNPGIAQSATILSGSNYLQLAADNGIDLTVVGPEAPLIDGVVDQFRQAGRAIFGPVQAATRENRQPSAPPISRNESAVKPASAVNTVRSESACCAISWSLSVAPKRNGPWMRKMAT